MNRLISLTGVLALAALPAPAAAWTCTAPGGTITGFRGDGTIEDYGVKLTDAALDYAGRGSGKCASVASLNAALPDARASQFGASAEEMFSAAVTCEGEATDLIVWLLNPSARLTSHGEEYNGMIEVYGQGYFAVRCTP